MTPTTPSAAGIDPAFIPGVPAQLDGAVPPALRGPGRKPSGDAAKAAKAAAADPAQAEAQAEAAEATDTADATDAAADATPDATAADDTSDAATADDDDTDAADDDDSDADDGKPVFKAADRRGTIAADRAGITFTLDEEIAEFWWDEIGAVEIHTPHFGRRFGVTVYTSTRRWFSTDIEAPSRKQLKQWAAELDAVLDARFEQDEPADAENTADAGNAGNAENAEDTAGTADAKSAADTDDTADAPGTTDAKAATATAAKDGQRAAADA